MTEITDPKITGSQRHRPAAGPFREQVMSKRIRCVSRRFSGDKWFVGVTVNRHPETGYPLLTTTCKSFPNDATVVVDGIDRPGVTAYVTGLLREFRLSYDVCTAERGIHGHGMRFEFPPTPATHLALGALHRHLQSHPDEFRPGPLVGFDRVCSVSIRIKRNGCGLLSKPADYLASRNINLRHLRVEKREAAATGPAITVSAEIEVPGIDGDAIESDLLRVCPDGSEVQVHDLWKVKTARMPAQKCAAPTP